jgi:hypothetical protein
VLIQDLNLKKTPSGISIPAADFFPTVSVAAGDAPTIFAGCAFGDFFGIAP